MKRLRKWIASMVIFMFCSLASNAIGADKIKVMCLGTFLKQIQSTHIEMPFYERLKAEAGDKLDVQVRTMDELGEKGLHGTRQLKAGVFDIMVIFIPYISGDDPYWQAVDLLGTITDFKSARKVSESYRELFDKRLQEKYNGKLLAIWPYGQQVTYLKSEISSVRDFKGKKIRVYSPSSSDFVKYFGATGVTMPFSEVYPALQRGVIDGGISSILAGNTAAWYEVTKYFYTLPLGFGIQMHAANLDFWKKLNPEMREFLSKKYKELEDDFWRYASEMDDDGVNCNTNKDPCKYGKKINMVMITPSKEDVDLAKKAALEAVLIPWAKRCNGMDPNCSKVWNEKAGKVLGLQIPPLD